MANILELTVILCKHETIQNLLFIKCLFLKVEIELRNTITEFYEFLMSQVVFKKIVFNTR